MPSKFHKEAIKSITPKERKKAVAILKEVADRQKRFEKNKKVYPENMSKIPTQKILRYIDRRIADNNPSEKKLLKEFKGMILAYENEASLMKAMSEMSKIAIITCMERHKKKQR